MVTASDLDGVMNQPSQVIIGIDEVGRGCCFGPLTVCAVCNPVGWTDSRVRDSKTIKSEKRKNDICAAICAQTAWSMSVAHAHVIDEQGITPALEQCMIRVLDDMVQRMEKMLRGSGRTLKIQGDGNDMYHIIARYNAWAVNGVPVAVEFMPGADAKVFEVSAASIVAKASRDLWCHDIVREHPTLGVYGIEENKGYGTPQHARAIIQHGLTQWHRKTFSDTLVATHRAKAAQAQIAAQQSSLYFPQSTGAAQ